MSPRARGAVVAAVAALALVPATAQSARRTVPRGWVGMVAGIELSRRPALVPAQVAMMARAGAESVRAEFSWSTIEPSSGVYRWRQPDTLVQAAARHRLSLVPTVLRAPAWAAADLHDPTYRPRDPREYAAFMTALVHRYGPRGSFWHEHPRLPRRPVRSWQVWNEPDQQYFWHPPWVKGYVALLRAADRAIHRADPRARTVLAGLTYRTWDDLRALYRRGAGGSFDVAALHPYTHSRRGVATTVRQVEEVVRRSRRVMRAHGDARAPIWLTELSWPSGKGKAHASWDFVSTTRRGQGVLLKAAYRGLASVRRRLGIGRVFWFSWMTHDRSRVEPFDYAGLRVVRGRHIRSKPALRSFRAVARRLEGRR